MRKLSLCIYRPLAAPVLRLFGLVLCVLILGLPAKGQDTLRVTTYNLLQYGGSLSGCTPVTPTNKNVYLKQIMAEIRPDIFGVNELGDNTLYAESILQNVLKDISHYYERTAYTNNAQSGIVNGLFYNSLKLGLVSEVAVNHFLRDINVYRFYFKDVNLSTTQDTTYLTVVQIHYKAGSSASDANIRSGQADALMNYLLSIGDPGNMILMGDLNLNDSNEAGYQKLVAPSFVQFRVNDPVNSPGIWGNSFAFRNLHTQSTRSNSLSDCGAGGGLDDRYDFVLMSDEIINNQDKMSYVSGSYQAYGNDGNRFNGSINDASPVNTMISSTIANALYAMSDHLPVMAEIAVDGTAPIAVDDARFANFQVEISPNPAKDQVKIRVADLPLTLSDLKLRLLDLSGQEIQELQMPVGGVYAESQLDVSGLPAGFYLVQLLTEGKSAATLKLIKQ